MEKYTEAENIAYELLQAAGIIPDSGGGWNPTKAGNYINMLATRIIQERMELVGMRSMTDTERDIYRTVVNKLSTVGKKIYDIDEGDS